MTASPSLKPHASIAPLPEGAPVLVCILDGWGAGAHTDKYNAVASAETPVVDKLSGVAGRYRTIKVSEMRKRGRSMRIKKGMQCWRQRSSKIRWFESSDCQCFGHGGVCRCRLTLLEQRKSLESTGMPRREAVFGATPPTTTADER